MTELWHATCPGNRDIEPPKFVREEVIVTSRGELQTWRCAGCQTIIRLGVKS